jgi:hypothetical protein
MGYSSYVGRVGALAVALGIGSAIANGAGVAWAETGSEANDTSSADATGVSDPNGSGQGGTPSSGSTEKVAPGVVVSSSGRRIRRPIVTNLGIQGRRGH